MRQVYSELKGNTTLQNRINHGRSYSDQWMTQLMTVPELSYGVIDITQLLQNYEIGVSLLQIAVENLGRIENILESMSIALDKQWEQSQDDKPPERGVHALLEFQKMCIREIASNSSFKGKSLLDGNIGLQSRNSRGFKALAGAQGEKYTRNENLDIVMTRKATHSEVIGVVPLTPDLIRQESMILIREGDVEIRYEIAVDETEQTLVRHIQDACLKQDMDLTIFLSEDHRLGIRHNQWGSMHRFTAMSQNTAIVSIPFHWAHVHLGHDCAGLINGQPVDGNGRVLIYEPSDNQYLILWEGEHDQGTVEIMYMPVFIQTGLDIHDVIPVYIRSCLPQDLGCGVENHNQFSSLDSVRIDSWQSVYDARLLVAYSQVEVRNQMRILQKQKHTFQELAMMVLDGVKLEQLLHTNPFPVSHYFEIHQADAMNQILNNVFHQK
ncbi:MAG: hypothetical protein HQM11_02250 [SAR324 cluster bacterium]|nr:hypothetical protein [SAR324 cluster bacterium]